MKKYYLKKFLNEDKVLRFDVKVNNPLAVNFSNSLQHQQLSFCELQQQPSTSTILLLWTSETAFNININIHNNNPLAVDFSNSLQQQHQHQQQQSSCCELQQQYSTSTILLMWTSATAFNININNSLDVNFSNSLQHQQSSCCGLQQ